MKKLIAIGIAVMMVFACGMAKAETATDDVSMQITVNTVFGFEITNGGTIEGTVLPFDPANPDGYTRTVGGSVDIRAKTNLGVPWVFSASSTGLAGWAGNSIGSDLIMVKSWQIEGDGTGGVVDPAVPLVGSVDVYTPGSDEYSDLDVPFSMSLEVDVPWEQPTDTYQGTVLLTMTTDALPPM